MNAHEIARLAAWCERLDPRLDPPRTAIAAALDWINSALLRAGVRVSVLLLIDGMAQAIAPPIRLEVTP